MADIEPKLNIDGVEYLLKDLTEEAKAQIQSLQFVEAEIGRLNALVAVAGTARLAYQSALKELLPNQTH
ncbi:MAG TPA: hypothetical protein EYQ43_11525 [Methyloprofundus sp.]|uniref:DUF6447 family protein n=1 Tax=Methyloprofundus sp. TaxID=2020875 RepID=UPI001821792D|nr:DUF6447 family protein [Methyloprofundus sp.]HIG66151.1 hypothetical protein [Methyloprofundus sp.]HIL77859.1 hypothetical protein [Methylococcales bacterium]